MSLRFIDSFDHYPDADLPLKWTFRNSGSVPVQITSTTWRVGSSGQSLQANGNSDTGNGGLGYVGKIIDQQGTWIIGFGFKASGANGGQVCFVSNSLSGVQGELRLTSGGLLQLLRNGTVVATSTQALQFNVWYFVEFKWVGSSATGTLEVQVNGSVWATFTGNTLGQSQTTADTVALGSTFAYHMSAYWWWDDFYACDGQGSVNNTYLGDCRVVPLRPSGAGTTTQFTSSQASPGSTYRGRVLADSPLHLWDFQEASGTTFADSGTSSTLANGSIAAGTGYVVGTTGPFGSDRSLRINGDGTRASMPDTTDLELVTGDWSIEFWWQPIAFNGVTNPIWKNSWYTRHDSGWDQSSYQIQGIQNVAYAWVVPQIGQWAHVVYVKSGSSVTLYINGTSQGTGTGNAWQGVTTSTSPLYIGANSSGGGAQGMLIAYLAIYGFSLSANQVTTHYNKGTNASPGGNASEVADQTEDGDNTYVYGATVGNEDTYAMGDLSSTNVSVKGVQTVLVARKDDAGPRTIAPVIRSGGTDYPGSNVSPSTSYQQFEQIWENDPATGTSWTPGGVNSAEAGVKVTG